MFENTYKGLKVLVTGHTGFKGSWLAAWLLSLGAEVAGLADGVPTEPANFSVMGLPGHIRDFRADVRDRAAVVAHVQSFQPDVVFHLAAQALVRKSYADPALTFETNMLGTLNVLEALRVTPSVRALVCITSDKAYRNDEWVWGYREQDALGGHDPYSASKGCAEIIAHAYFTSYFQQEGPACATTRAARAIRAACAPRATRSAHATLFLGVALAAAALSGAAHLAAHARRTRPPPGGLRQHAAAFRLHKGGWAGWLHGVDAQGGAAGSPAQCPPTPP